jgi:hypothetical protein
MQEKLEEAIKATAEAAAKTKSADEAMKFTQAALNAAHALATLILNKK